MVKRRDKVLTYPDEVEIRLESAFYKALDINDCLLHIHARESVGRVGLSIVWRRKHLVWHVLVAVHGGQGVALALCCAVRWFDLCLFGINSDCDL
jgi:hypothetical protein